MMLACCHCYLKFQYFFFYGPCYYSMKSNTSFINNQCALYINSLPSSYLKFDTLIIADWYCGVQCNDPYRKLLKNLFLGVHISRIYMPIICLLKICQRSKRLRKIYWGNDMFLTGSLHLCILCSHNDKKEERKLSVFSGGNSMEENAKSEEVYSTFSQKKVLHIYQDEQSLTSLPIIFTPNISEFLLPFCS